MAGTSVIAKIASQVNYLQAIQVLFDLQSRKVDHCVLILLENPATFTSADGNDFITVQPEREHSSGMKQSSMLL